MKRRNFMMTMATAVLGPLVNLRKEVSAENLMRAFCAEERCSRFDLESPFGVGSLTYATDSRAMIRAELSTREEYGQRFLPPVRSVWPHYWNPTGIWAPVEEFLQPTIGRDYQCCPECGNRRVSLGDQYPEENDPRLIDYDPDDNSVRDTSCVLCHGRDFGGKGISDVMGVYHMTFLLRRIAALPNALVCRSGSCDRAILFKADGFEGISLGVTDDEE